MGGDGMDYYEVGQRIRRIRKAKGMSQEFLADKVGISITHMSHIETANTKLSLTVFIAIADALDVSCDALLYDYPKETIDQVSQDIAAVLESCTVNQSRMIAEIVKAVKQSFDEYM